MGKKMYFGCRFVNVNNQFQLETNRFFPKKGTKSNSLSATL